VVVTSAAVLIDVTDLVDRLAGPSAPTVLDVRWRLSGPPGRDDYRTGHIPSATFLDLDEQLCGPPGPGGRHPLPDPAVLERALRGAGVRDGHPVVVYDYGDGMAAARLWWTLRWAGMAHVRVLDGGFAAWTAAGAPTEPGEVTPAPGDLTVRPGGLPVLDADGAAATAGAGTLIDARQAPRFRGETEPIDPVAGRIPGARNVPAADLVGPDGRLLPVAALRERFTLAGLPGTGPIGAYCGSGVTAAQTVLALTVAGYPDPALYVGSWSEWITNPDRPVATG
jgi:thiosulfate/3-mercaptopyruvate sulfurtransferase